MTTNQLPPGYTFDQVMDLWVQAGGAPQSAAMAAAVADASSGLNPSAQSTDSGGIVKRGLWQISSTLGALSTTDPRANARAAIQLSNGGTDFSKWCAAWSDNSCGANGGTYLADGSNALASLAQRGGTYNVIGGVGVTTALPQQVLNRQTGQPATGADLPGYTDPNAPAGVSGPPAPSTMNKTVVILLIIGVVALAAWLVMRRKGGEPPESPGE